MNRRSHSTWCQFGAMLAGTALALQLVMASWGMLLMVSAAAADPFGGHTLCLASPGDEIPPAAPANQTPAVPLHHHGALCCLLHPTPAVQANPVLAPEPVAFASAPAGDRTDTPFLAGQHRGPANARAPPILA